MLKFKIYQLNQNDFPVSLHVDPRRTLICQYQLEMKPSLFYWTNFPIQLNQK